MVARRVDNTGFEIVQASPQVIVTVGQGHLIAGTLQLLTTDGATFEQPLGSTDIAGAGWDGQIIALPQVALPGVISPIAWIVPDQVTAEMLSVSVEVDLTQGAQPVVNVGANFQARWTSAPPFSVRSYSLRPTLTFRDCAVAQFAVAAGGAAPEREDEGNAVRFGPNNSLDDLGVTVDVDATTLAGLAITLRTLLGLLP